MYLTFRGPCIVNVFQSITNKMQRYTFFYFCKPLYMFRVDPPPIIRSVTLYLQHLVFVKPLLLTAVIVEELRLSLSSSTIAAVSSNGLTNTRCYIYSIMLLMMGGGSTRNMYSGLQK